MIFLSFVHDSSFSVLYDTRFFVSTLLLINRGGKKFSVSWYLLDISRLVKGLVKKEKIEGTNRSDHGSVSNKLSPRFFALHAFVESLFEFFEILVAGCVATDRFERVDSYVFPFHRISPYARNFPSVPFFAPEPDGFKRDDIFSMKRIELSFFPGKLIRIYYRPLSRYWKRNAYISPV